MPPGRAAQHQRVGPLGIERPAPGQIVDRILVAVERAGHGDAVDQQVGVVRREGEREGRRGIGARRRRRPSARPGRPGRRSRRARCRARGWRRRVSPACAAPLGRVAERDLRQRLAMRGAVAAAGRRPGLGEARWRRRGRRPASPGNSRNPRPRRCAAAPAGWAAARRSSARGGSARRLDPAPRAATAASSQAPAPTAPVASKRGPCQDRDPRFMMTAASPAQGRANRRRMRRRLVIFGLGYIGGGDRAQRRRRAGCRGDRARSATPARAPAGGARWSPSSRRGGGVLRRGVVSTVPPRAAAATTATVDPVLRALRARRWRRARAALDRLPVHHRRLRRPRRRLGGRGHRRPRRARRAAARRLAAEAAWRGAGGHARARHVPPRRHLRPRPLGARRRARRDGRGGSTSPATPSAASTATTSPRAVLAAARAGPPARRRACCNLADDTPATQSEVVAEAARLLGMPPPAPVPFADAGPAHERRWRAASGPRTAGSRSRQDPGGARPAWRYPSYREGLRAILAEEARRRSGTAERGPPGVTAGGRRP